MKCPKCKKVIEENSLKCDFCGAKVGSICPDCNNYNPITALKCSKCDKELIRICSECGAANLPDAPKCRKCGIDFVSSTKETTTPPSYYATLNSQQKAKAHLLEGIKDANSRIITISGDSGCGKNLVLRYTINDLKNAKLTWLFGSCTQTTQLSPFGYMQDLMLSFFKINNFCPDTLQLKKNSMRFFKQDFPSLTNDEIADLLNFLYPENLDRYENIYFNKTRTFSILKKVIFTILNQTKIVFIVDKFEYIDGMSFDFLKELLEEDLVLEKSKIILITTEPKPGMGMLTSSKLTGENYLDISMAPFTSTQSETFIKQFSNIKLGKDFKNLAEKISKGNPAIIEQMIFLQNDIRRNELKNISYKTFEDIVKFRLSILRNEDFVSYRILVALSILGSKFCPAILDNFENISPEELERVIEKLINNCFITPIDNLSFEFKTQEFWKIVVATVKNDQIFEEILNTLYETLCIYKQSSIALLGYIVQKLNNNDKAFDIWTLLMKQASYIGDIGLYIVVQKQALKLIENKNSAHYLHIKKNIYTRVGKLLEPIDHNAAFEYLQNAVMLLDDEKDSEHIELLGYLASCSMKSGNYWGAIECTDNVLNKLPAEMKFEKTLVKTRQLAPLLKLGNYGQLINTVETEILNDIEKNLSKGRDLPQISIKDLFETWLCVYFNYAEAIAFQGDNRVFEIIQTIYDILDKNKTVEPTLICRTNLLLALANTIKGDTITSKKILDDILKEYSLDNMDTFIVSRWNFIDILNKFFEKDYDTLHTELFNVAAYANNINDNFTKNILKTLLAKILKDNNQTKKSLEILEEQVAYFAKEKVATGVLLSWYLIAKIKLITTGSQFALDIATKALDIAQGANINNYYFMALFNELIGEIYLAKQDFESAKVYLEKAIVIEKQFDLQHLLVKTYLLSANLYQELALPKTNTREIYIKQALKMFQFAKNVPIVETHAHLQKKIKDELAVLTSFCKLNGIVLKKDSK